MKHPIRILAALLLVPLLLALVGPAAAEDRRCDVAELVTATLEVWYDSTWNDHSDRLYTRDPINITRGISNEGGRADPGTATFTINNRDGEFSPRNPRSSLYGKIGRNSPVRIKAGLVGGTLSTRFVGEVVAWPVRWDVSGEDVYVPVTAAGIMRRLGIPGSPLRDSLRRFATLNSAAGYWPLDDPKGSTSARAVIGQPMDLRSSSTMVLFGRSPSKIAPLWTEGNLAVHLPAGIRTSTSGALVAPVTGQAGGHAVDIMFRALPEAEVFSLGVNVIVYWANEYEMAIQLGSDSEIIGASLYDDTGSAVSGGDSDLGASEFTDNQEHWVRLVATDGTSGDVDWSLYLDGALHLSGSWTASLSTTPAPARIEVEWWDTTGTRAPLDLGQVVAWNGTPPSASDTYTAAAGHTGETAGNRASRLCGEEGVSFTSNGTLAGSIPMGPQKSRQFLDLLDECAHAEAAGSRLPILVEQRGANGLHFNTRASFHIESVT